MGNAFGVEVPEHTLLSRLGRGGMASVYLAQDETLGRLVAVKVIDERFEFDENFQQRFEREARIAAALAHPNIVPIYRFGSTADKRPYLSMAYLDGGNLRQRLQRRGALPVEEALAITRQIAGALHVAHGRNIVHRDLKPDNVLFQGDTAFLTDFGIAKLLDANTNLTGTGTNPGTVRYFSPEQAQEQTVDKRSDIYTLGVVLYEMLTGTTPIGGDTLVQIIVRIAQTAPAPLPDRLKGLQPLMDVLLAKDPNERLATCADVVAIVAAMERNWVRYASLDRLTDGVVITSTFEVVRDGTLDLPLVANHDAETLLFPDVETRYRVPGTAANAALAAWDSGSTAGIISPRVLVLDRTLPPEPFPVAAAQDSSDARAATRSATAVTVLSLGAAASHDNVTHDSVQADESMAYAQGSDSVDCELPSNIIVFDSARRLVKRWWIGVSGIAAAIAAIGVAYLSGNASPGDAPSRGQLVATVSLVPVLQQPSATLQRARSTTTSLTVLPEPNDAHVRLKVGDVAYAPGMTVAPGTIHVRVEKAGHVAKDVALDVRAGMANAFDVRLVPVSPALSASLSASVEDRKRAGHSQQ